MKPSYTFLNIVRNFLFLISGILFVSCSSSKPLNDSTASATLWVQNAAEYTAITTMVYQSAGSELNTALNVRSWTASLEQENALYKDLPPAVILDVDETVLDNSPFQARLIKKNESYTPEKWNDWVREEKADAIAGALSFTQEADRKGIEVFYLTNREASVEDATYNNLEKLGFPLAENKDVLLTKNERPDWTSAKTNRRQFVAKNHRILMLFGDNLNDFLPADDITHEQRRQLVEKHRNRFGTQWFVLPNPVYGSWEQALYDFEEDLTTGEVDQKKREKLNSKN